MEVSYIGLVKQQERKIMGEYYVGVDMAQGSDYTMYCVTKTPGRFMRWINKVLKRGDKWKIIYCGDDERIARKYIRKATKVYEERPDKRPLN